MQKAEIISIGNELLSGKTIDTTSAYIGRKLAGIGITVQYKSIVPDQTIEIINAVKRAWNRSSVILITGGLGSTKDDITKKAVTSALGLPMAIDHKAEASIRQFFKRINKKTPDLSLSQALIPEGSIILKNSWGTAPGIYIKREDKRLFMLPGVPHETTNMLTSRVLPILSKELGKKSLHSLEINIFGIGELRIQEKLEKLSIPKKILISYLPDLGSVKLALSGDASKQQIQSLSIKVQKLFKDNVYSLGNITLEQALGKILKQKKHQLAVAESCTGGLLAGQIVNIPGSSSYFPGGVIAYSNKVKTDLLSVSPYLIKKYGAVSLPVAKAMAIGVAKKFSSKCAIGITGVAGPSGGTPQKPAGYVCIASSVGKEISAESFHFYGSRLMIRQRSVSTALFQMISLLKR